MFHFVFGNCWLTNEVDQHLVVKLPSKLLKLAIVNYIGGFH